jgi:hypothetical protein
MKKFCCGIGLLVHLTNAYAGGGSSLSEHCRSYTKSFDNLPCVSEVVHDLFECGYKSKFDSRGLSEIEANRADYCMFQKGYWYRGRPDFRSRCDERPDAPGCADIITPPKGGVN